VILGALLLQFWSRYLPSPWAVLVGDDWANLARSSFFASNAEAAWRGLQDPNRPLSMIAVNVVYRWFGDRALPWTILSLAGNSLLLLFTMKMALELTGRRMVAALTGLFFALLPNLTETYHWSTQVLNEVACALVPYALSGWMWVAYVRRGGRWRLAVSALAYGVGVFSYEAGILLPAAYLVLLPWKRTPVRSLLRMAPIGLAGLFYLAWRGTNAFGLNPGISYPTHMQAGPSLMSITMNSWHLVHWWAGDYLFGAILSGFQMFASISLWTRRFLFVANVGVAGLVFWGLQRLAESSTESEDTALFSRWQIWGFALAWTAAAMGVLILSYTGGRLNVIPGIGVSLLAALALSNFPVRRWGPWLALPVFLALVANQGTAENWRQSGIFARRLYAHLEETADQWREKPILLLDTRTLRQRRTPGLLRPVGEDQTTWALYGNSLLLRGFVPIGMVQLITGEKNHGIQVLLDVEYGARIDGDQLRWHARHNPARLFVNSMDEVFLVDAFVAGQMKSGGDH